MKRCKTEIMGSRVAYWEAGQGKPVVLVHGIRGNHRGLQEVAQRLVGRRVIERRVILVDLPGHGESTPMHTEHSLPEYVRFLEAFCAELGLGSGLEAGLRLEAFDLWAHSFGANLAMMFAAQTKLPLRRLVLVSPAMENGGLSAQLLRGFYGLGSLLPSPLGHFWLANPFYALITGWMLIRTRDRRLSRRFHANEQRNLSEFRLGVVAPAFVSYFDSSPWSWVAGIAVPTLVIGGRQDALVTVPSLARLSITLADGRLAILEGTGHLAPLEEPRRIAELTMSFLA